MPQNLQDLANIFLADMLELLSKCLNNIIEEFQEVVVGIQLLKILIKQKIKRIKSVLSI